MKRVGFKAGVFLVVMALISLTATPFPTMAAEPAGEAGTDATQSETDPTATQPTGAEVAGGGDAGRGVARSVDPVILRNSLVGLAILGLLAFSVASEAD